MSYAEFLQQKRLRFDGDPIPYNHEGPHLYPFQADLVGHALERGRAAIFADCGLGKTLMELDWAANVPGRVLLLAPLAVARQIEREAMRFGYDARTRGSGEEVGPEKIVLTNYERLHRFDPSDFDAIVLDESSILKAQTGKTRAALIRAFGGHSYRLACTATPSPNDFTELGNHAEFLGVMTAGEMLALFFVHDGGSTQDWRLKGHAQREFWRWVGTWASLIRRPSDMGYSDDGFVLPPLRFQHVVCGTTGSSGALIPGTVALDLQARRHARRSSMDDRCTSAAALAEQNPGPFLFWCDLNAESERLASVVEGAVEVTGSQDDDTKTKALLGFAEGSVSRLVTKPRIGGWGMNWQRCHQMAFVGLSDSYEALYQATRRCWRFGQKHPVTAWLIYSEDERAVIENVMAKERKHAELQEALVREVMA